MNNDQTVTIDGKNYLKSDITRHCDPVVVPKNSIEGESVKMADRFTIDDDVFMVVRLSEEELQLINLKTGNRWSNMRSKCRAYNGGVADDLNMFARAADRAKRVTSRRVLAQLREADG